jgi:hypothetical protein
MLAARMHGYKQPLLLEEVKIPEISPDQVLARPRLRPARGIRQFDSAERGAAGFSGLAKGGTEVLIRGKSVARLAYRVCFFTGACPQR